jgi:hypothetical protein
MMPRLNKIIVIFLANLLLNSCAKKEEKVFTVAEYEAAAAHMDRDLYNGVYNRVSNSTFIDSSQLFYATRTKEGTKYLMVDLKNSSKKEAFDHEKLADVLSKALDSEMQSDQLRLFDVSFSEDLKNMTFIANGQKFSCRLSDYALEKENRQSKRTRSNEHVSPNGKLAAYINNYNLWVRELATDKKTQLTFDGQKDYGYATNNAGWVKSDGAVLKWSPNSDKIATFQQDARKVGMMYLTSTNVGHPNLEAWKHPLPGDEHIFTIERVLIHLGNQPKTVRLKMKPDFQRGTTTDHIADWNNVLLDAQWNKEGTKFAFVSGSRDHKIAHLQIADAKTGKVTSIHKEEVATYYESGVDAENWYLLFDTNEFIWYSERTNWGHLYLYDVNTGKLKNQITSGDWVVKQIKHIDQKK